MRRWLSELLDRLGIALARRVAGRRESNDPDRQFYLESAARIGVRVAAVSAALVISVIVLLILYIVWQATPEQIHERHGPADVHIYLDTVDIAIAVSAIGVFTVVLACAATWIIASRAVRPLGEALRMQRRFVADASHELRTPLAVLSARAQRLQTLVDDGDPRRRLVDELREDARVMVEIVTDMLDTAAGEPDEADVASLTSEISSAARDMEVIAGQHQVVLQLSELPDVTVRIPPVRLRRAVVSLLDNAIDHTPEGGSATVAAALVGNRVRVEFSDTGHGITGIEPDRVFDRFAHGGGASRRRHRATRTGYGIGLSLVQEIAVRHGGSVAIARTGPEGTTFVLELPVVSD